MDDDGAAAPFAHAMRHHVRPRSRCREEGSHDVVLHRGQGTLRQRHAGVAADRAQPEIERQHGRHGRERKLQRQPRAHRLLRPRSTPHGRGGISGAGRRLPISLDNRIDTTYDRGGSVGATRLLIAVSLLALMLVSGASSAPPALRMSDVTVEATGPDGADATYTVKAFDPDTSAPLDATCDTPPGTSGSGTFSVTAHYPLGTTTVTCQTTTTAGDTVTRSADVIVQDTTPPQVTAPADVSVTTGDPSGAVVSYGAATATDIVDGTLTPTCAPASGSKFPVGTTTVTCTATDAHGNTGSASFTVTVTVSDTTPPVVTVPSSFTVTTQSPGGATATYSATATDDVDGALTPTCNPPSGSTFPVGTTTVTCSATDAHGNTGSASFQITVVLTDTTPPDLTVPGDFSVNTSSPSGTAVSYAASANDNLDGAIAPVCAPASGSTFPVGATTVTCTATDAHGNTAQKSFTVTVVLVDTTPPSFSNVPGHIRREADGPAGSVVTYAAPTAVDSLDGPVPVSCAPASGATFRLGTTTVTCTATDAHGNTATATFEVTIVDTTPPRLVVPPDSFVYAETPDGISAGAAAVQAFLALAAATDLVDEHPTVTNDAPAFLPVGATTITFTAQDASGNTTRATAVLTVKPQPPPGTPQPPPPVVDRTPPDDVAGLKAKVGNRLVRLTWKKPKASDFDHVEITRALAEAGSAGSVVYRGAATSFRDRGLQNGAAYRYVVVSVDHAGNASAGVAITATPKRLLLVSPPDGAKLKTPPRLVWVASAGADYYNVQLFRGGTKILSVWPTATSYQLKKTWKYQGRRYQLTAGLYRWYVWPGLGAKAAAHYGPLIGTSTFQMTA